VEDHGVAAVVEDGGAAAVEAVLGVVVAGPGVDLQRGAGREDVAVADVEAVAGAVAQVPVADVDRRVAGVGDGDVLTGSAGEVIAGASPTTAVIAMGSASTPGWPRSTLDSTSGWLVMIPSTPSSTSSPIRSGSLTV